MQDRWNGRRFAGGVNRYDVACPPPAKWEAARDEAQAWWAEAKAAAKTAATTPTNATYIPAAAPSPSNDASNATKSEL